MPQVLIIISMILNQCLSHKELELIYYTIGSTEYFLTDERRKYIKLKEKIIHYIWLNNEKILATHIHF